MTALIIVAHAPLASAFRATGGHCFAEQAAHVHALDVRPDDTQDTVAARLRTLLQGLGEQDVLVLADTPGATPYNAVQQLLPGEPRLRLVAGLNLPMLWRSLCYLDRPLEELQAMAREGGLEGIRRSMPG